MHTGMQNVDANYMTDTPSIFRTVRSFERVSRIPAPRASHVRHVVGFPGQSDHAAIPAKSPRQGPTWGRRGAEVDLAGMIPNISVWYAVWYISFSTEPNVIPNPFHARKK